MSNKAAFWNKIAASYISDPIKDVEAYEHKLALMRPYLFPEAQVLEIGCGSGNTGRKLAPLVEHYTATDIAPEMIRLGLAEGAIPDNMEMVVADCDHLDYEAESFDAILAMSLIHLVEDPLELVLSLSRMLKPGGVLISSTAAISYLWPLRLIAPPLRAIGKIPYLQFLHPDHVRALMRDAGLEIVEDWHPTRKAAVFLVAQKPD